ncbi:site-specific tyrosine recombinase XerD [Sphingobacterium spiritivorum]|uniref:Tyrosine recombinase XerC n=1 Tax=Sphingobacterium spiritivorum ATCC 33861 TaxID=525373 RepID=D7VS38_SPHSI|nr:site-specific tyrosine recombinase XerD [Sphingobacterium spiritivorum]EFK56589.1 tyrosine recombinase XerD [Sphingobacterium spiritivorum ATCC 33861]QQT35357.1 site-specific tyrosine recombinase XerD [Sphingobacterium spiritivorum]WQD32041.1 site-specific tyrosine recombinase XerD [Sphingobacterium spiritivorum]SUJ05245.1 Tyrosine recombinase XerD [Sphingobacterium spiritivorum]
MEWEINKKDFKRYLQLERGLAPHSIEAYLNDISKLEVFCTNQQLTVNQLSVDHLQEFLVWLNTFNISPYTQSRLISGLKAFFGYLQLEGLITKNPAELIQSPRLSRKIPVVLNIEEIDQLIGALDLSTTDGMRNKAILEILYGCGLRVSELVNLRISNLFLHIDFIKVEGKGNKERLIPIGQHAIKYLNIYLNEIRVQQPVKAGFEDYVFLNKRGTSLSRVMIFLIIKDLAAKTGLQKEISPHTFRHSFASHLVEGGADLRAVQDMLGHESITTTEIYTHIDRDYLHAVITQYHPRS